MKRNFYLGAVTVIVLAVLQGCASGPKPIPSAYFEKQRQMSVTVSRIDDPKFRDSGNGGLIGLAVGLGRSSDMKDMFAGIKGDTVKELIRQEIEKRLEGTFVVEEDSKDLALDVEITHWGWFLPTTAFGIKTGSYQLEIFGSVTVNELGSEKKEIAGLRVISQKPLGSEPTAELTQQALKQAIEDFADKARDTLLREKRG